VAALLEDRLGVKAQLVVGRSGEFTVWVGEALVARKTLDGFPTEQQCLEAVRAALGAA
jgi:hypothetical protein